MADVVKSTVRAAGGVPWRRTRPDGAVEVLLIHSAVQQRWSWPKGKVDAADADESHTALREVWEETGLRCSLGRELASAEYVLPDGRPKRVRFWAMQVLEGAFTPNREVDEVAWLTLDDAAARLVWESDQAVLRSFRTIAEHQPA